MLFKSENDFNKEFLAAALDLKIPVSVLKGVASAESAFNAKAFRAEPQINDGSYGLMQILYKTAKGEGYNGTPGGLLDPAVNIMWGSRYLAGLLKRHADLSAAVASYNMGFPRKAKDTTPAIVRIYGEPQPSWTYANQPYVDRVLSYISYFQTFEKPDPVRRAAIEDLIKKKISPVPPHTPHNPFYPSPEFPLPGGHS